MEKISVLQQTCTLRCPIKYLLELVHARHGTAGNDCWKNPGHIASPVLLRAVPYQNIVRSWHESFFLLGIMLDLSGLSGGLLKRPSQ